MHCEQRERLISNGLGRWRVNGETDGIMAYIAGGTLRFEGRCRGPGECPVTGVSGECPTW